MIPPNLQPQCDAMSIDHGTSLEECGSEPMLLGQAPDASCTKICCIHHLLWQLVLYMYADNCAVYGRYPMISHFLVVFVYPQATMIAMADSFPVLQDTASPWHCVFGVFGVPVFAMLLQSFPGASAVMEENEDLELGDLHLENQLRLSTLMIPINPLTNQYKSTRMSVHPATMHLL